MDVVQLNDMDRVIVFGDEEGIDPDNQHVILAKDEPAEVSLYPNPVQQGARLFFLIPESVKETCSVRVLDMQGKVLDSFDQSNGVRELETSNYPAGMYFVNFTINGKNQTRKFSIVQ